MTWLTTCEIFWHSDALHGHACTRHPNQRLRDGLYRTDNDAEELQGKKVEGAGSRDGFKFRARYARFTSKSWELWWQDRFEWTLHLLSPKIPSLNQWIFFFSLFLNHILRNGSIHKRSKAMGRASRAKWWIDVSFKNRKTTGLRRFYEFLWTYVRDRCVTGAWQVRPWIIAPWELAHVRHTRRRAHQHL